MHDPASEDFLACEESVWKSLSSRLPEQSDLLAAAFLSIVSGLFAFVPEAASTFGSLLLCPNSRALQTRAQALGALTNGTSRSSLTKCPWACRQSSEAGTG